MKINFQTLCFFGLFFLSFGASSQVIFEPEGVNMPGGWNNFDNPPAAGSVFGNPNQTTNGGFSVITVGTRRYHAKFNAATTGGDAQPGQVPFLFTSGPAANAFSNKWADVTVALNTLQTYNFNNTGGGNDNSILLTDGKWYTVNFQDQGYVNTRAIFMETSAEPVSINTVTQTPSGNQVLSGSNVTITVTTSATPSPEEKIYVRYSTDGYASQNFIVPVTMNGTTGTATIPAITIAGTTVSYYVFSTTIDSPTADWDMVTINLNNNTGLNFQYDVVSDPVNDATASNDTTVCQNGFPITLSASAGFEYLWNGGQTSQSISVSSAGTYTVVITNAATGNTKTIDIDVAVSSIANFSLGSDQSICGLSSVVLDPGITLSPNGDSLVIEYDATKGTASLIGANRVYMHSGVQFAPFGVSTNWIGNWGQDDGVGLMTSLGNNRWRIAINVFNYYGITPGTSINALEIVFRNADGSLEGKDYNNQNIFLVLDPVAPFSTFDGITGMYQPAAFSSIDWSTGETTETLSVTTGGTYSATVTDIFGCTATDEVVVNVYPAAFVDAGSSQVLCNDTTVTLDAGPGFTSYSWSSGQSTSSISVSDAGTYTITVTDANGCTAQDIITLSTGISPDSDFSFDTTNGLTVSFTASNQPEGTTYAWDFTSNGSTDNTTSNPSFTFPSSGTYNTSLTVTNACGSDVQTYQITVTLVGIDQKEMKQLQVYPNPFSDVISIISPSSLSAEIVNSVGLTIKQLQLTSHENSFDLSELPQGIYLLKTDKNMYKIIKK